MIQLICYDISKNNLRTKMSKRIIEAGLDWINKSVYLGAITESSLKSLENDLSGLMLDKGDPQDSLIFIPATNQQIQQMRVYGENGLDKDELTGQKSTLIL